MLKLPTFPARLLMSIALSIVLTGCGGAAASAVDMSPVGIGLKFIGIGLVVMALVFVLGENRN